MTRLVTVARFRDLQMAELARGKLEYEGIPTFLADHYTVGLFWTYSTALGGVKVRVREDRVVDARAVLEADESATLSATTQEHWAGSSSAQACIACESEDIERRHLSRKAGAISLATGLPVVRFGVRLHCRNCGTTWRPPRTTEPFPDLPDGGPDDVSDHASEREDTLWREALAWLLWVLLGVAFIVMLYQYAGSY